MNHETRSRIGRRLFLAFALLYLLTAHGRYYSDDIFQFEQVHVFVETGQFVMSRDRNPEALGGAGAFMRPGTDGRVYFTLPPGLALAASPLGFVGSKLGFPTPEPEFSIEHTAPPATTFWASLTVPLVMAAAAWAFFSLVARQSGSERRGIQAAFVLGLATNTWFFATTFWTQPVATACWIGAATLLVIERDSLWFSLPAGALAGYGVATRFEFALFVPWFFVLVASAPRERLKRGSAFVLPLIVVAVALLAWNEYRFGDPLETRSLHQGTGLFKLERWPNSLPVMLLGPGEGLLVYSPATLLGLASARAALRANPALSVFALGMAASMVLAYGAFAFWSTPSPMSWGNRFLYPAVPWIVLLAFISPAHEPLRPTWARVLVVISGIVGLAGIVQRVRLGPPVWWIDEPGRAAVAVLLAVPLTLLLLRLRQDYAAAS